MRGAPVESGMECPVFLAYGVTVFRLSQLWPLTRIWCYECLQASRFSTPLPMFQFQFFILGTTNLALKSAKKSLSIHAPLSGENWQLVTDVPVEFKKWPVEVWDFRRITDQFRGIYRIYLKWIKQNWKISTCNRLDLDSLGSWTDHVQKLPRHWYAIFGCKCVCWSGQTAHLWQNLASFPDCYLC